MLLVHGAVFFERRGRRKWKSNEKDFTELNQDRESFGHRYSGGVRTEIYEMFRNRNYGY
jgi:hypothetical protein